jgi:chromosome segregation ATPase
LEEQITALVEQSSKGETEEDMLNIKLLELLAELKKCKEEEMQHEQEGVFNLQTSQGNKDLVHQLQAEIERLRDELKEAEGKIADLTQEAVQCEAENEALKAKVEDYKQRRRQQCVKVNDLAGHLKALERVSQIQCTLHPCDDGLSNFKEKMYTTESLEEETQVLEEKLRQKLRLEQEVMTPTAVIPAESGICLKDNKQLENCPKLHEGALKISEKDTRDQKHNLRDVNMAGASNMVELGAVLQHIDEKVENVLYHVDLLMEKLHNKEYKLEDQLEELKARLQQKDEELKKIDKSYQEESSVLKETYSVSLQQPKNKLKADLLQKDEDAERQETENSQTSERGENKINEEEWNYLRQQLKKFREEINKARKMYEDLENEMNDMKMKVGASTIDADRKKIKDLEDEVQHLKDRNKRLADEMATEDKNMSEIHGQVDALNKEKNELADTNKHAIKGKMKINP